mgnify:CR=1 FL=1
MFRITPYRNFSKTNLKNIFRKHRIYLSIWFLFFIILSHISFSPPLSGTSFVLSRTFDWCNVGKSSSSKVRTGTIFVLDLTSFFRSVMSTKKIHQRKTKSTSTSSTTTKDAGISRPNARASIKDRSITLFVFYNDGYIGDKYTFPEFKVIRGVHHHLQARA